MEGIHHHCRPKEKMPHIYDYMKCELQQHNQHVLQNEFLFFIRVLVIYFQDRLILDNFRINSYLEMYNILTWLQNFISKYKFFFKDHEKGFCS